MKKHFVFITARRKELRGGNMKKRRLMLCSLVSLIMVFVMAVPMTVSAAEKTVTTGTLQEAINNAASGDVIKLGKVFNESITIPADKNITLDLNGKTLTGAGEKGVAAITNNGTLTIKDSIGNGKISRNSAPDNTHYVIDNQETLTIESGEISITSPVAMPKGASLIRNAGKGKEATLTITGGKIFQNGFIAVKNDDQGILKITGGEIGTSGDTATNTASAVQNWGKADITGGTIGNVWSSTWKDGYESVTNISGDVNITGKIVARKEANNGVKPNVAPKINISGGSFNVEWSVVKGEADIAITGGNYTSAPDADFVAEDHLMIHYRSGGNDGKYYVGTNKEIQKIVDDAEAGDTIDVIHGNANLTLTKPGVTIGNKGVEKVVVNGQILTDGTTTVIKEVDPTKPSQDQTQKPSDTAKADKSAKTGDDFNLFAVGGVALAAIIAMAAVAITGRRHRQR